MIRLSRPDAISCKVSDQRQDEALGGTPEMIPGIQELLP